MRRQSQQWRGCTHLVFFLGRSSKSCSVCSGDQATTEAKEAYLTMLLSSHPTKVLKHLEGNSSHSKSRALAIECQGLDLPHCLLLPCCKADHRLQRIVQCHGRRRPTRSCACADLHSRPGQITTTRRRSDQSNAMDICLQESQRNDCFVLFLFLLSLNCKSDQNDNGLSEQ